MTFETRNVDGGSGRLALKPAQETALAELEGGALTELTRADYEELTRVSRSQAAYDLADLVTLGVLERVGAGRATRYRLGRGAGGRTRKWTDDRIRAELEAFCAQVGRWPRAVEFREAGHGDLYLAASRYGGIDYWAGELGFRDGDEPELKLDEVEEAEPEDKAVLEEVGPAYPFPSPRPAPLAGVGTRAALLVGVIVLSVLTFGGLLYLADRGPTGDALPPADVPAERPAAGAGTAPGRTAAPATVAARREAPPVTLRLRAAGGSSWLEVRAGGSGGKLLYRDTLAGGRTRTFSGKQLWLRLGAPANLGARLNGRALDLPGRTSTVLVTKRGLRVLRVAAPAPAPAEEPVIVSEPVLVSSSTPSSGSTTPSSSPVTSSSPPPAPESGTPSPDAPPTGGPSPTPDQPPQRP